MAAPRDLKRETARRRREQMKRNREAAKAADERQSKMERRANLSPSERRLLQNRRRAAQREGRLLEREGHRVTGGGKQDRGAVEDKMLDGTGLEDKGLDSISFGSKRAREVAEEKGLTLADFLNADVEPSGEDGYLTGEVRQVAKAAGK